MRSEGQNGDSHHLLSLRGALEVETRGFGAGGGTFPLAMGARVFLDLHQENPAEPCRHERSMGGQSRLE